MGQHSRATESTRSAGPSWARRVLARGAAALPQQGGTADPAARTAEALRGLANDGWVVRDALAAPFGNVEHVVVGPPGIFLLGSRPWSGPVVIDPAGVPVVTSADERPTPRPRIPHQLRRAASEHVEALRDAEGQAWLHPVAVIWSTFDAGVVEAGGVAYVHGDELVDWLRSRRTTCSRMEVRRLTEALGNLPVFVETGGARH